MLPIRESGNESYTNFDIKEIMSQNFQNHFLNSLLTLKVGGMLSCFVIFCFVYVFYSVNRALNLEESMNEWIKNPGNVSKTYENV